jgi:hypothetical protein
VERFPDFAPRPLQNYIDALRQADPNGNLLGSQTVPDEYLFRTSTTARNVYFDLKQVDTDLWVLSMTVPTVQEGTATSQLFDKIRTTFTVSS